MVVIAEADYSSMRWAREPDADWVPAPHVYWGLARLAHSAEERPACWDLEPPACSAQAPRACSGPDGPMAEYRDWQPAADWDSALCRGLDSASAADSDYHYSLPLA